ncbi:MAG TPA: vitamin B12-dependent ribonucleotide reductase [Terriglobia bacterium]|nr:vitamin B12-dependent ribonucleotide reductase [Terriglobia bacterium]
MLEKQDVRKNRNGRAASAPSPFTAHAPSRRGSKPDVSKSEAGSKASSTSTSARGLKLRRYFTAPGDDGFAGVEWELRTAAITGENGKSVFEQRDVEVPKSWSQTATNVVVQKYFRGTVGTPERERSVRQLISRVADTITAWGRHGRDGKSASYFADEESAAVFNAELKYLLVTQRMAFNSPVWFNVGSEAEPQCSACFINSVDDTMESILGLAKTEGMLFKYGSGTGTNLSPIRSSKELLQGGGTASGPVSFMRGFDAFAGVIKSGGKTRRAAKMVMLDIDHPDVDEFIWCKAKEEKKAWTLIDAGYDGSFDGEAYKSIFFQNSNNSVRVTDDFMEAVEKDRDWSTRAVRDGKPVETMKARRLWRDIAEAAWQCGDPGLQYDTTINDWHTSSGTARINASNPCSEYMFLDDSACNLASLNLLKFLTADGKFDVEAFRHAVDVVITAQEILVDNASYPTEKIARNSHDFRPLGLGYANLGALLMASGLPYDSDGGRDFAAAITACMHGQAYLTSSRIAAEIGAFPRYPENRDAFLEVITMHRGALDNVNPHNVGDALWQGTKKVWDEALASGMKHGYRNGQVTVLAPTGTIGFMMDCDTTGVEPDLALVKYKKLVGGGLIKIVNNVVPMALLKLGYTEQQASEIVASIDQNGTIEGAPHLKPEHLPVFDCSLKPANGKRAIHYMGHVRMMAAVQPFLSGAISKTVNLPEEATVEDISNAYLEAWRMGIKAVAIYRDGSKRTQPLNTSDAKPKSEPAATAKEPEAAAPAPVTAALGPAAAAPGTARPFRRKLPDERRAVTHKFSVGGHEGYLTVGLYDDGMPGEIFITMAKEGSTVSGLMDSFATAVSLALQYGVPLKVLCDKFSHTRFEPSGWSSHKDIGYAKSLMDYIFRWLAIKFLPRDAQPRENVSLVAPNGGEAAGASELASKFSKAAQDAPAARPAESEPRAVQPQLAGVEPTDDAPSCSDCGAIMVRNGACYRCMNCGGTSGCS